MYIINPANVCVHLHVLKNAIKYFIILAILLVIYMIGFFTEQ